MGAILEPGGRDVKRLCGISMSALIALRDFLNSDGDVDSTDGTGGFRCADVNVVEVGQVARNNVAEGMRAILSSLARSANGAGAESSSGRCSSTALRGRATASCPRSLAQWGRTC